MSPGASPRGEAAAAAAADPGAAPSSASRRRARRSKKKKAVDANMDNSDDVSSAPLVSDASPPTRDAPAAGAPVLAARRVLKAQVSRERSPRRDSLPLSSTQDCEERDSGAFAVGSRRQLQNLVSRPDLCGSFVQVLSFDAASGRYGVKIDLTGETIKVRAECLAR